MIRILLICLFFVPTLVCAQSCPKIIENAKISLPAPKAGAFALWVRTIGQKDSGEAFKISGEYDGKGVVIAGVQANADKSKNLTLMEIDNRGSILWKKSHKLDGFKNITTILVNNTEISVVGNTDDKGKLWKFDRSGNLKNEFDVGLSGVSRSLLEADGSVVLIRDDNDKSGVSIVKLDKDFKISDKKHYSLGAKHVATDIALMGDKSIISVGWIKRKDEVNQRNYWIGSFDENSAILWQRSYDFVGGFSSVSALGKRYAVAAGSGGDGSLRIAAIDLENGNIMWSRKVVDATNKWNFSAIDIDVDLELGGIIRVLVSSSPRSSSSDNILSKQHAEVLTFSPRGDGLKRSSYYYGTNTSPSSFMDLGDNRSAIIGSTILTNKSQNDGWIVALPKAQKWINPCAR